MATNLFTFAPTSIRACASSADHNRRKASSSSSSSSNWWAPVFGWSSEPDYIDSGNKSNPKNLADGVSKSDPETKSSRNRFSPGCFTESKARQLRLMTMETESFHDVMYHSAIASRLATDFKSRGDS
ncbi:uncharacterized protein LOC111461308 [Cucurbita moschata]|uniref:Uncharacterized protein LOC111461308 n=1 Tax=Cucurbita moschata TaxID=3662 RepID=A0A6J1HBD8_CUCMO|nr:uncharacterized protein LOC111461308 [Cucurbita moschata]